MAAVLASWLAEYEYFLIMFMFNNCPLVIFIMVNYILPL